MGWSEWKNFGGLTIPYWEVKGPNYMGNSTMKLSGCTNIKIGLLEVSDTTVTINGGTRNDNSYFGVFDINDTSLSNPIYKKTKGTKLENVEIDVSGHDGVILYLYTNRPSALENPMYVRLTNLEIS